MTSICGSIGPSFFPQYTADDSTAKQISTWNRDLQRAARARTISFGLPSDFAADLEQEGRLGLLIALRRYGAPPERLMRTVVANAVLKKSISEARWRRYSVAIETAEELPCQPKTPNCENGLLGGLLQELPGSLQTIFQLLYVEGLSQRIAAVRMSVSQPRVTELHKQLKRKLKAKIVLAGQKVAGQKEQHGC
jgi:RNA polymerase sigma factor (sigma-70 family)